MKCSFGPGPVRGIMVQSRGIHAAPTKVPVAVSFGVLGSSTDVIEVDLVVMLLIVEPDQQVDVLTRLIRVFQLPHWDASLRGATQPAELAQAFDRLVRGGNMDG